jgi:hypothetical protein
MVALKHQPSFEIRGSKAGGYVVIAVWPTGLEQEIDGFVAETEARIWIDRKSAGWTARNPHSRAETPASATAKQG